MSSAGIISFLSSDSGDKTVSWQNLFFLLLLLVLVSIKALIRITRFHSFTDGNIPSVCDRTFVGKLFTDYIADGISPSEYLLSVIPHSVAISVGNTKKTFTDGPCAPKKKFPAWNIPTENIPSVLCKNRRNKSVGKSVGDI